jgi:4-hydroxy-2-oxoheptanedioate aldolase
MIRPLELDAAGVMYPHCMSAQEAAQAVWTLRFHPIGRRPIDGGNIDGDFCTVPLQEYVTRSNEQKFLAVQIEDKEAIEHIEGIVATPGIDVVFVGPGDLSHSLGAPGETDHPAVIETIERVERACRRHGRHWGLPASTATIRTYYDRGARFFATCADVVGLHEYFKGNLEAVRGALA